MSEFRKADSTVYETFLEMIEKVFPELSGYSFGLLFREKVKKSRGRMIFAEICLPGKLLSYFARNDNGSPYDFLIVVDEMVWATARQEDRVRIMRHELRHVYISEKGSPKLVDHDFQDFYAEVDLNADDPSWTKRVAEIANAGYEQVKGGGNDPRLDRRDADDIAPVTKDPQRQVQIPLNGSEKKKNSESIKVFTSNVAKSSSSNLAELEAESKKFQNRTSKLDDLARKRGLLPPLGPVKSATA